MIALNRRAEADRDANAKLREAAPDMLAALRIIAADEPDLYCACMALGWFGDGHNAECPVGIAENAIAKAEGRAHA